LSGKARRFRVSCGSSLASLAGRAAFAGCLRPMWAIPWVVYAKRPFGGPEQVLDYLARYTHRVAIANSRLVLSPTAASASYGRITATMTSER
jgi:Putative transposase